MAQKKGQTGNPNGRPKGKPNNITTDMKSFIAKLLKKNRRQLEKDFAAMEPEQRWKYAEKLIAYIIPKQKAIEANINLEQLSDEQLDMVIDKITNNISDDESEN